MNCANCNKNDGVVYTSNPPKYLCTVTNEFHDGMDSCDVTIPEPGSLADKIASADDATKLKLEAVDEFSDKLKEFMSSLWKQYEDDKDNVPKPNLLSAYALLNVCIDSYKSELVDNQRSKNL